MFLIESDKATWKMALELECARIVLEDIDDPLYEGHETDEEFEKNMQALNQIYGALREATSLLRKIAQINSTDSELIRIEKGE